MNLNNDFDNLTNQQKYVLSVLYEQYLSKLKTGYSVEQAKYFGSVYDVQNKYFNETSIENLQSYLDGLNSKQFTNGAYGDGVYAEFVISDKTIVYFENKFKNNLKSVMAFIKELRNFIVI